MISVLLLIPSTSNIAFVLIFPFLPISYWGVVVVVFATIPFVTLIVRSSLIPLVQLLSQLLIALGKPLNCCGEDLHLSLQGIVGFLVSWLMVAIDRV